MFFLFSKEFSALSFRELCFILCEALCGRITVKALQSNTYFAIRLHKSTAEELSLRTFAPSSRRHFNILFHPDPVHASNHHSHLNRHLDYNAIETFDNITLSHLQSIENLRLEGNSLVRVPTKLLTLSTSLEAL